MNKIIITIIFSLLGIYANAQYCWETKNTETTDWRSAASNNTWDWTQEIYTDIYITNRSNPISITSPFWAAGSGSVYRNASLFDFQKYKSRDKKDFHPEDGWELLVREFGTSGTANSAVTYPFFALYNKYNGKVRAFLLIPDKPGDLSKTGAMLKVAFPDKRDPEIEPRKTAIFQHMKPIGMPVESFDGMLDADMTNVYSNEDYYWIYSEFTVAYDPCTCEDLGSTKESTVEFTYFLIEEAEIDAKISGTLTERVAANQKPTKSDPSFALNDFDDVKKVIAAGQKSYKAWDKYKTSFNKQLKEWTDSVYRDKLWKSIDTLRVLDYSYFSFVTKSIFKNWNTVDVNRENFMNGSLIVEPENLLIKQDNDFLNSNFTKIKNLASVLPYIGTAIGVIDLFIDGGEKTTAVKGPTVFEANLMLEGNIKKVTQTTLNGMFTPGYTTTTSSTNFIPTYNNILGVFNVLELPEFEYYEILPKVNNKSKQAFADAGYYHTGNQCKLNFSNFNNEDGAHKVLFKQYKPKSNLKYVLNPASNLEVISIESAIILEYRGNQKLYLENPSEYTNTVAFPYHNIATTPQDKDLLFKWEYPSDLDCFTKLGDVCYNIQGQEVSNKIKHYQAGSATVNRIKDIESNTNLNLDYITANYPIVDTSTIRFRTSYLPITCFNQHTFTVLGTNNFGKIFTKLYIRLKRKDDPHAEPITLILSYDLSNKIIKATRSSETGSYLSEVSGKKFSRNERCCFKCGNDLSFWSIDISDYSYSKNFKIVNLPNDNQWFTPRNMDYAGQKIITTVGNLNIPDGSLIPENSLIRAVGTITLGKNLIIGRNTVIQSEKEINVHQPNTLYPDVVLEITQFNSIAHNCSNFNYTDNEMTNDEISSFCNSKKYKNQALLYKKEPDPLHQPPPTELHYKLYPNPTTGQYHVAFSKPIQGADVEVTDVSGKTVQTHRVDGEQTQLDLDASTLKAGIYFITIKTNNGQMGIQRLVKY